MSTFGIQYSYAGGSIETSARGFRVIEPAGIRFAQLTKLFPLLKEYLRPSGLVVSIYPAALGLLSHAPFVDTYLHPITFIRAMRLAAIEDRPTLLVGQPLVAADFLVRLCDSGFEIPRRILLLTGGYYFPRSLEGFTRDLMAQRGCELEVLHSYGVAEIGHTLFAADRRFEDGSPQYKQVASEVEFVVDPTSNELTISRNGVTITTGDLGFEIEDSWRIQPSESRLAPSIRELLESWKPSQWLRRTGHLLSKDRAFSLQVRENHQGLLDSEEVEFYEFWKLSRTGFPSKPRWFI